MQALVEPIEVDRPINVYFQQLWYAIQLNQNVNTPFTPAQIVQAAYHAINKAVLYYLALKE